MTDLAGSMGKLLAMWMDRDPQSRRSSIETYLAPDVEFRSPFGQARGYDELEKYSDYLRGKYPGTGFFVDGPVQLIGDYVRLPFVLKEHDGSTVATGQDFLWLAADGRAELMYAFSSTSNGGAGRHGRADMSSAISPSTRSPGH